SSHKDESRFENPTRCSRLSDDAFDQRSGLWIMRRLTAFQNYQAQLRLVWYIITFSRKVTTIQLAQALSENLTCSLPNALLDVLVLYCTATADNHLIEVGRSPKRYRLRSKFR